MTNPDLMMIAVANFNREYTRHGTTKPKWKKLKNVTPSDEQKFVQLEFNFEENKEDYDKR